jgi:hypothetical protein
MRALTLNELQFVSGGDLPQAPDVFTTTDMLNTLENAPVGIGTLLFAGELVYNFSASVQFGLTAIMWGVTQLGC